MPSYPVTSSPPSSCPTFLEIGQEFESRRLLTEVPVLLLSQLVDRTIRYYCAGTLERSGYGHECNTRMDAKPTGLITPCKIYTIFCGIISRVWRTTDEMLSLGLLLEIYDRYNSVANMANRPVNYVKDLVDVTNRLVNYVKDPVNVSNRLVIRLIDSGVYVKSHMVGIVIDRYV
ncbi:hypothetical protein TIFTF001_016942 [Ficus carica]|uniref:Uncharacterized protein n=1 Tax=Ficus carica TaxID=3494 RepID=A0AA88A419_FICCA|nr:hypothetical protein TIFTF001_016942 [Ficus carica]